MLKYPLIRIYTLMCTHYQTLVSHFDLIDDFNISKIDKRKVRLNFAFEFVISLCIFPIGTLGLYYETYSSLPVPLTSVLSSPVIIVHQVLPKQLWGQVDTVVWTAFGTVMCIAFGSMVQPFMDTRFRMATLQSGVLQIDGLELRKKDSAKILKIHQNGKLISQLVLVWVYLVLMGYFYAMVLISSVYQIGFWSFVFWILIFPIFCFYITFEMFDKIIFVLLTNAYVLVRQKSILAKLSLLRKALEARSENILSIRFNSQTWRQYLYLNSRVTTVCRHLGVYSTFWSPFLTLTFANYITYQCYVAYSVFFVANLPLFLRVFYVFCLGDVQALLLFTTGQCAKVVKCNQTITKENRRLYGCFQSQKFVSVKSIMFKARVLLKAESFQVPRLLHRYAFTMFGNYRITSKTFHVIISYVCILFLTVIKNRYNNSQM